MWDGTLTNIKFTKPDPQCKTCQLKTYPSLNEKESFEETVLCGRNTIQLQHHDHFNLQEWQKRFSKIAEVFMTPFLLKVDRKSTRLNSSHVAISYADFYLKNK